jgi:hypothetical protein
MLQDVRELQLTDNPSYSVKDLDGPTVGDGYVDRLVSWRSTRKKVTIG